MQSLFREGRLGYRDLRVPSSRGRVGYRDLEGRVG